jgi:hypothetical protein
VVCINAFFILHYLLLCDDDSFAGGALGCPMTFKLLGSLDNNKFDVLFQEDLYDYSDDYGAGGKLFYFLFDSVRGRVNGQRCGSCASGPGFTCHIDAYDASCDSRYCGRQGLCAAEPKCPVGAWCNYMFQSILTCARLVLVFLCIGVCQSLACLSLFNCFICCFMCCCCRGVHVLWVQRICETLF